MGFFSKAKDNYDRRKDIAEYNYKAREYVSEGQRIYEDAYENLRTACYKTQDKIYKYVRYKKEILNEINRTLRKIDVSNKEIHLSMDINFRSLESSSVVQEERLDVVDKMLATWTTPSLKDFFVDVSSSDYYMARSEMQRAKSYRDRMKMERERLRDTKYAVQKIPDFLYEEQRQIDSLMEKFRKTADGINQGNSKEKVEVLKQIAEVIAGLLTTQFLDNNYQITSQYMGVYNQISAINKSSLSHSWLIGD